MIETLEHRHGSTLPFPIILSQNKLGWEIGEQGGLCKQGRPPRVRGAVIASSSCTAPMKLATPLQVGKQPACLRVQLLRGVRPFKNGDLRVGYLEYYAVGTLAGLYRNLDDEDEIFNRQMALVDLVRRAAKLDAAEIDEIIPDDAIRAEKKRRELGRGLRELRAKEAAEAVEVTA